MLQPDTTLAFPYRLLGQACLSVRQYARNRGAAKAVLYGDYAALACNMRENVSVEVLSALHATQHALGVVRGSSSIPKIMDNKGLASLVMSAT